MINLYIQCYGQANEVLSYVDPFIGTTTSDVITKWGSEGGTYPGAAAPSGYMQLTPQTRKSGYDYKDSSIFYFSCFNHSSGFPGGSSGNLFIMPVNKFNANPIDAGRSFQHKNEKASAGYYSVLFDDDNTLVEATATKRSGFFRITFAAGVIPKIFIGDADSITFPSDKILHCSKNNTVINFNESYNDIKHLNDGVVLNFTSSPGKPSVIIIMVSASPVGFASAQKNIDAEQHKSFDLTQQSIKEKWRKLLSIVDIDDSSETNKTKFYSALYHSLLIPWIISDVNGNYKGADGKIYKTTGQNEYGNFSPWDTYRSLNPLLCLLYPAKATDVISSMLDVYKQSGYLPTESMTGNHAVSIITDAYLKGIKNTDSNALYKAMKKSILAGPFIQPDMEAYNRLGYIPFTYPESVTRTVEYAYDDWALAQFAMQVMKNKSDHNKLLQQSYNYRNLFNKEELFMLPRNQNEFKKNPGNTGYKEGDKWVYSYSVQHHANDLINLMGGDEEFTKRLNEALKNAQIVFDNETVFHVPYLFNMAGHPALTQKWVRDIMHNRFKPLPGGLPGNDDLGSTSSWFVFSALGLYPFCPGNPSYTIGSPLFKSVTIHLANKKIFTEKSNNAGGNNIYVRSLLVNGKPYTNLSLSHASIMNGGEMVYTMDSSADNKWFNKDEYDFSETKQATDFKVYVYSVSKKEVVPDENFWVHFSIKNNGSAGTKVIRLFVNGKENSFKNCFVSNHSIIKDSISCRLYEEGAIHLSIDEKIIGNIEVVKPSYQYPQQPTVTNLLLQPVIKKGNDLHLTFLAQNIGGVKQNFTIPVLLNNIIADSILVRLSPGEKKEIIKQIAVNKEGLQTIRINNQSANFKVYKLNKEATILDLRLITNNRASSEVPDNSGFQNNGKAISLTSNDHKDSFAIDKNHFIEVPDANSLDNMDSKITMMAWVYPTKISYGLTDLFTKGDNHVLQVADNKQLTFFAGGWGRGDCTVPLPADWQNHWHHIAGVCNGKSLNLYIDGELKGTTKLTEAVNLSNNNKWTIGRNEEFPSQRIFTGYTDKVKVFAAPLSDEEILQVMKE